MKEENFKKSHNSIIAELFFGFQKTSLVCNKCGHIEGSYGIFNFLIFPLEKTYNSLNNMNNNFGNRYFSNNLYNQLNPLTNIQSRRGKKKLSLYDCFKEYFKPEMLCGENKIYCNSCKKLEDAMNKIEMYMAPHVLILILNRGKGNIFECEVDFPKLLDLKNFIKNSNSPKKYNLI